MIIGFESLRQACIDIFNVTAGVTNPFVVVFFIMRIAYAQVTAASSSEFTDAFKGAVTYFILIAGFPWLIEVLLLIPQTFTPNLFAHVNLDGLARDPEVVGTDGFTPHTVPGVLSFALEAFIAILYYAAAYIHVILLVAMCGMAPIVFLFSCMLGLGVGIKIFIGLMVLSGCWPVLFSAFEIIQRALGGSKGIGASVLEFIITLMKTISPLWLMKIAMQSGPGKAVTAAATGAVKPVSMVSSAMTSKGGSMIGAGAQSALNPVSSGPSRPIPNATSAKSPTSGAAGAAAAAAPSLSPVRSALQKMFGSSGADRTLSDQGRLSASPVGNSPVNAQNATTSNAQASTSDARKLDQASQASSKDKDSQAQSKADLGTRSQSEASANRLNTQNGSASQSSLNASTSNSSQQSAGSSQAAAVGGASAAPSTSPISASASHPASASGPASSFQGNPSGMTFRSIESNNSGSSSSTSSNATGVASAVKMPTASTARLIKPQADETSDIQRLANQQMLLDEQRKRKRG